MLEMPFYPWTDSEITEVVALHDRYKVVIVHPERYIGFGRNKHYLKDLREAGLLFQVNTEVLLSRLKSLRINGIFHHEYLLGSDSHNMTKRPPNLREARELCSAEMLKRIDDMGESLIKGY